MIGGKNRCRISVQVPVKTKQANASVVTTWVEYIKVWAKIETLKGFDRQSACASWPAADQQITCRYFEGLLPTMRIVYKDMIYSILGVNNIEMRNREYVITTQSGVRAQ